MSFNKRVIIFLIVACITFYFLPVNTFAVAPAVSPTLPVGFTPFSDLPGNIEDRFYQNFYDLLDYLFNGNQNSQIKIQEKKDEIIEDAYISRQQANEDFNNFINDILNGIQVTEFNQQDQKEYVYSIVSGDSSDYKSQSIIDKAIDISIKELNSLPQSEIYGPFKIGIREQLEKLNNKFEALKEELGLVDHGKSFLSGLKEYNPYIQEIKVFDYNNFYYYVDLSNCPSFASGNYVNYGCFYYVKDNKIKSLNSLTYCSSNPCAEFKIENNRFFYRFGGSGNYYSNQVLTEPYPEYVFLIIYIPVELGVNNPINSYMDLTTKYIISPDDLVEVPAINPSYQSDLEKAAKVLADQLGVDVNRILDEFSYVIDENGERYLESATGIRTAIDDLVKVYNESIAGNTAIINSLQNLLDQLKAQDISGLERVVTEIETTLDDLRKGDKDREALLGDISGLLGEINERVGSLEYPAEVSENISTMAEALKEQMAINSNYEEFNKNIIPIVNSSAYFTFPLYDQCKYLLENVFNYNDQLTAPNFDFYFDSDNNGTSEQYKLIDLSVLDHELNNSHMVDKSIFATPIKVITFIRYILCAVIYGLFITRLLKRLPSFYGSSPLYMYPFLR